MRASADLPLFSSYLESGQLILTPGKRLARQITYSWLSQLTHTVARPPSVQPVDAWLEQQWRNAVESGRLPAAQLLSPLQEQALWQYVVREDMEKRGSFSLSHPKSAALRAQSAWHKLLMHNAEGIQSLWDFFKYDDDCAVFASWVGVFSEQLSARGAITRYQAYQQLRTVTPEERPCVALYPYPALPPLTSNVLDHLCEVTRLHPAINTQNPCKVVEFSTREDELWAVARWARDQSEKGLQRIGIVLLDMATDREPLEYHLREVFDCLDASYNDLPVNFSTGMPLASTPMYRDLLLALEWEVRPITSHQWLSLVRSPYLEVSSAGHERLQLISAQFRSGSHSITIEQGLHLGVMFAPEIKLTEILRCTKSDRATIGMKSLAEWAEVIRHRIALWGWPYRSGLDSIEYQQLSHLEDSFDALATLATVLPHQHFSRALHYWRECLAATMFQPKTPQDSIQVLGPLEALGGQFDAMWVCGAQQHVFPTPRRLEPFIPAAIQKQLRLSSFDDALLREEADTMLSAWIAGSAEVTASYHCWDQDSPRYPSELLPPATPSAGRVAQFPSTWTLDRITEPMPAEPPLVVNSDSQIGGASLIKDQAACPFRAFIKHRFRPTEIADPVIGLSAAERGALFHDALFHFWRHIQSQSQLLRLDDTELSALIDSAVTEAMAAMERSCEGRGFSLRERVGASCWDLEKEVLLRVMAEWMELEKSRKEPFVVDQLEVEHSLTLGNVTLSLRPDRIDRMEAGGSVVIDYKSRAPAKTHWLGDKPQEPQLPLYTLLDEDIEGIAFGELSVSDPVKLVALSERYTLTNREAPPLSKQTDGFAENWPALTRRWKEVLEHLAADFAQGEATVDPTPTACQYCALSSVCRIQHVDYADEPREESRS